MRKNVFFTWNKTCKQAFELLKKTVIEASILTHFDLKKQIYIKSDSFDFVFAEVLSQMRKNDEFHSVTFFSKNLASIECNYEIYDKELLTIVESYWLAKEWIATAVSLKWMRNSAHYIENLSHSSIYWFSSSDSSRFIWGPRSSFVTKIFSSDQDIFVLRCHFDLISSRSHIHLRTHWFLDNLENQ
jgi:hypothetical protein